MDDNPENDFQNRLVKLSEQERAVLKLRCQGKDYKEISQTLFIAVPTVKQYMSRIYVKLGLDTHARTERLQILFRDICPLLKEIEHTPPVPGPEIQEAIPTEVFDQVDEDENAIVIWQPNPLAVIPKPKKRPVERPYLIPVVVSICLVFIVAGYILFREMWPIIPFQSTPITPSLSEEVPTNPLLPTITQAIETSGTFAPTSTFTPSSTSTMTHTPYSTSTPKISLPFEDTFTLRADPEWEYITGTWRVVDGHFTADTDYEWQIAFIGDPQWHNYRIEVTTYSQGYVYPVQIIMRASESGYLSFHYNSASARWILVMSGAEQELASLSYDFDQNKEYILTIDVQDDIFTAYVNGLQISQIQDTSLPRGKAGLGYMSHYLTWFDDFKVTALP